jgi:CubicO group peptidase (beta-lactamase class C family)
MLMHMNRGEWNGVRIISAEHAGMMQAPMVDIDATAGYGLAIRTDRALLPGAVLTGHTGSAYGLYSSMFFDGERKYGFVVIANGTRDAGVREAVSRTLYEYFIAGAGGRSSVE